MTFPLADFNDAVSIFCFGGLTVRRLVNGETPKPPTPIPSALISQSAGKYEYIGHN